MKIKNNSLYMRRVFVTGIGVISALGDNVASNHRALVSGDCGLSKAELVKTKYADLLHFGEVKVENDTLIQRFSINDKGITRTSLLALQACNEAITDAALSQQQIASFDTALIVANTVGGMCLTDELFNDSNTKTEGSPFLASYDNGSVTLFLQQRYGIKGVCNTINTACSSSANAIMYGARLIQHGIVKRAIVGGADSLAKFTINGFNSLGILSSEFCRPFDETRNGLNLAEGAGFLILEAESDVKNKKVYAELTGYANTNDAYHASTLSPEGEGAYQAMTQALALATLSPEKIGFINTHGTGTENNDLVESVALKRVFQTVPAFASSKSKIGHSLGASGGIEAVFSLLAMNHQEVYPSLHFETAIPETGLIPVLKTHSANISHVMCNSFGFGGNCSSLVFSKV